MLQQRADGGGCECGAVDIRGGLLFLPRCFLAVLPRVGAPERHENKATIHIKVPSADVRPSQLPRPLLASPLSSVAVATAISPV